MSLSSDFISFFMSVLVFDIQQMLPKNITGYQLFQFD